MYLGGCLEEEQAAGPHKTTNHRTLEDGGGLANAGGGLSASQKEVQASGSCYRGTRVKTMVQEETDRLQKPGGLFVNSPEEQQQRALAASGRAVDIGKMGRVWPRWRDHEEEGQR